LGFEKQEDKDYDKHYQGVYRENFAVKFHLHFSPFVTHILIKIFYNF